jgi:hypothetical protein
MLATEKPFVQLAIDQVDTVVLDLEGRFDPELFDRYKTFDTARDAALTSIEVMLDEADYDGDDHREELERMLGFLEASTSIADLQRQPAYQLGLKRLETGRTVAA